MMSNISFHQEDDTTVAVIAGDVARGCLRAHVVRPGNDNFGRRLAGAVDAVVADESGIRISWRREDEGISATLDLTPLDAGYAGVFRAAGNGHAIIRLEWELPRGENGFPFVPAFMYGHNEGGGSPRATYPQLQKGTAGEIRNPKWGQHWVTDEWLMRADRSSHGFTSVITSRFACAIGGRDVARYGDETVAEKNGLGTTTDPHRLSFSLGFTNQPFTYSAIPGRNYISRPEGFVNLDDGAVAADVFLFHFEHDGRQAAAARLLRESYALLHDLVDDAGGIEAAIRSLSDALVDYGYSEKARNFRDTLPGGEVSTDAARQRFRIAWGGGVTIAYPLLVAGRQLKNERWSSCARTVISNIAANAISEKSSLFYENYYLPRNEWNIRGWWYHGLEQPGHSAYVNAQACHYMLLAYLMEKQHGNEQPAWLAAARRVLDHVARVQADDGGFGHVFSEADGSILDGDGFSGCWFVPAFATLYRITGKESYRDIARRAMDFYRKPVAAFHVYGAPHDANKSPDEEGILAWIDAARILHQITGEQQFLDDLLIGLDYELSWKFAYNVVNEVEPLKSKNWCSTGGSVTSVNNAHIHPMGCQITASMLYAAELTGDPYIRSRLIDTVRWGLTAYLHHDGDYGWGKKGMVTERFCYTDSLLLERFPDGTPASTWFCAHPWAAGSILEGLTGAVFDAARDDPAGVLGRREKMG